MHVVVKFAHVCVVALFQVGHVVAKDEQDGRLEVTLILKFFTKEESIIVLSV